MKHVVLILFAVCSFPARAAEPDGAFGIRWGSTPDEVRKMGVTLRLNANDFNLAAYEAWNVPKDVSGFTVYTLVFDDKKGLFRGIALADPGSLKLVQAINTPIEEIRSMTKNTFERTTGILKAKYTCKANTEVRDGEAVHVIVCSGPGRYIELAHYLVQAIVNLQVDSPYAEKALQEFDAKSKSAILHSKDAEAL